MYAHMKNVHSQTKTESLVMNENVVGKRKAALRAVTKLQDVLKIDKEAENEIKSDHYSFYKKGEMSSKTIPKRVYSTWSRIKLLGKPIMCLHGCGIEFEDLQAARLHYFKCMKLPEEAYYCNICHFNCVDKISIEKHITKHLGKSGVNEMEDVEVELEEEDDDLDEFEVCTPRVRNKSKSNLISHKPLEEISFKDNVLSKPIGKSYKETIRLTFVKQIEVESRSCAKYHTKMGDWIPVNDEEMMHYVPNLAESLDLSFNNNTEWRRLKRFKGDLIDGMPTMFTGGAVRSFAWCSVSINRSLSGAARQYLAVSSTKDINYFRNVFHSERTSNVIQIWDCGILKNSKALEPPSLSLGIAHDFGDVWCLEWAPFDYFEPSQSGEIGCIGQLAAAGSDGAIRIYSVCDPRDIPSNNMYPIFKCHPVILLLLSGNNTTDSCTRICWSSSNIIVAGYSSGMIGVFNLEHVSIPYLCSSEGHTTVINAFLSFQAHGSYITALAVCPLDPRYIVTGSIDRHLKFWDLQNTEKPFAVHTRGIPNDCVFAKYFPTAIVCYDESCLNAPSNGWIYHMRDFPNTSFSTCRQDGCTLSLSFNDWLNMICESSNAGEVALTVPTDLYRKSKRPREEKVISTVVVKKFETGSRFSQKSTVKSNTESSVISAISEAMKVFSTDLDEACCNQDNEIKSVQLQTNDGESNFNFCDMSNGEHSSLYSDNYYNYGLIINDQPSCSRTNVTASEKTVDPEEYPIASVNKVSFNPNLNSFSHIAVGYQCGLVRLQYLSHLERHRSEFEKTIAACLENYK